MIDYEKLRTYILTVIKIEDSDVSLSIKDVKPKVIRIGKKKSFGKPEQIFSFTLNEGKEINNFKEGQKIIVLGKDISRNEIEAIFDFETGQLLR